MFHVWLILADRATCALRKKIDGVKHVWLEIFRPSVLELYKGILKKPNDYFGQKKNKLQSILLKGIITRLSENIRPILKGPMKEKNVLQATKHSLTVPPFGGALVHT